MLRKRAKSYWGSSSQVEGSAQGTLQAHKEAQIYHSQIPAPIQQEINYVDIEFHVEHDEQVDEEVLASMVEWVIDSGHTLGHQN